MAGLLNPAINPWRSSLKNWATIGLKRKSPHWPLDCGELSRAVRRWYVRERGSVMTQIADHLDIHESNFSRFEEESADARPWLDDLRKRAMAQFRSAGFPNSKQEEWRFTNVAPIAKTPFKLALPAEARSEVA